MTDTKFKAEINREKLFDVELQEQGVTYVTERIANISELERYISNAFSFQSVIVAELANPVPDMQMVKEMSETVAENLTAANNFEFLIERRKCIRGKDMIIR